MFSAPGTAQEPAPRSFKGLSEAQCTPIDLRQGSLAGVPPTSQNSHGDCYIHAGVAMFQGYLRKTNALTAERTPSPEFVMAQALAHATTVNGESVAVSFEEESMGRYAKRSGAKTPYGLLDSFFDADFEGGRACHTVGRIRKDGTCSRQFVEERAIFYSSGATTDYLVALREYVKDEVAEAKGKRRRKPRPKSEAHCAGGCGDQGGLDLASVTRPLGISPTRVLYNYFLRRNRGNEKAATLDLQALMIQTRVDEDLAACNAVGSGLTKDELTFPECSAIGFLSKPDHRELLEPQVLGDTLHYLVSRNGDMSNPPAIEFCSSALHGEDGIVQSRRHAFSSDLTYLNDPLRSQRNLKKECGFHVATVIGRKWENGSCKLLVQDSNGCQGPNCERDDAGKPIAGTHVHVVDEGILSRNIVRIATIGGLDDFKSGPAVKPVTPGEVSIPETLLRYRDEIVPKMNQIRDVDDMGR